MQMGFNSTFKGLKLLKTPGNGRLNNLNDPVLNVLEMSANGRDPEPFISGGKQPKPWYLSFISLYTDFFTAMFTFLP